MSVAITVPNGLTNTNIPDVDDTIHQDADGISMPEVDGTARDGVLSKVKHGVGTVAKGAAVVTGVGVLGVMAGSTALAMKSQNKKDEFCASLGESMSYYLARLLGGNDHMSVQRLQQAGMKGVEMAVQNKKAVHKAVRPLPTLNMPVSPDNQLSY